MTHVFTDHALHRAQIAELFRSRPLEPIWPAELRKITPHYQQRISECRKAKHGGMLIRNIQQWRVDEQGEKHRIDGPYVYAPKPAERKPAGPPALA